MCAWAGSPCFNLTGLGSLIGFMLKLIKGLLILISIGCYVMIMAKEWFWSLNSCDLIKGVPKLFIDCF